MLPPPKQVDGRRRYDEGTVRLLKVVRLAQEAGISVADIQTVLHGFAPDTPPAARWQPLARQKLQELDALIARTLMMKKILQQALSCGCLRLEDCAAVLEEGHCHE